MCGTSSIYAWYPFARLTWACRAAPSARASATTTDSTGECATNKEKQEAFLAGAQEEAQREQTGDAEQADQALPTRRGKHGGLREIERTILKENMN